MEHAATWKQDATLLKAVRDNDRKLTPGMTATIARGYKVARTFHGVGERGYDDIAAAINAVDISPDQPITARIRRAVDAVNAIEAKGYSRNPSGVTKLLWFRDPDHWYMYDKQAANAVGAGLSSVQGMRGFFGILHACDVVDLNREIGVLARAAGVDLRPERIIDKFLWLLGLDSIDKPIARLKAKEPALLQEQPGLSALATAIQKILPDNRFDLFRESI